MGRVLCAIDDSLAAGEAVRAAVSFCREHNADLRFVGLVKPSIFDAPQPAYGEQVRRYKQVQYELARAAQFARGEGISPEIALRAGNPAEELLREADATMAEEVFLARSRSWIWAALTRRPRIAVARVTLEGVTRPDAERELKKAA